MLKNTKLTKVADVIALCQNLPQPDPKMIAAAKAHNNNLTKPLGALGRLEDIAIFVAGWQGTIHPKIEDIRVLIFAGNHGVVAEGVSPYPSAVTHQMVANFAAGGAAINQLAQLIGAQLDVTSLSLDQPTGNIATEPAMFEAEFLEAIQIGIDKANQGGDFLVLGEMGIGNTTAASAVCLGLLGHDGRFWAGPGTGLDTSGVTRKAQVLDRAIACHHSELKNPLHILRILGGRELAAMFGVCLAARHNRQLVMLDGFVSTAAVAPLAFLVEGGLSHCMLGHCSAEPGHRKLVDKLALAPLLDLQMRLGEGSGAALAMAIVKAALATHNGMASFAQAGVDEAKKETPTTSA